MTTPNPTNAELEILRVLWRRGAATVRQVHEELSRTRATGYTTVLKLLQIMTEKGLAIRDTSQRSHVYQARLPRENTQRRLVDDLVDRAFGGSTSQLLVQALSSRASSEDLEEIRSLLDSLEDDR